MKAAFLHEPASVRSRGKGGAAIAIDEDIGWWNAALHQVIVHNLRLVSPLFADRTADKYGVKQPFTVKFESAVKARCQPRRRRAIGINRVAEHDAKIGRTKVVVQSIPNEHRDAERKRRGTYKRRSKNESDKTPTLHRSRPNLIVRTLESELFG